MYSFIQIKLLTLLALLLGSSINIKSVYPFGSTFSGADASLLQIRVPNSVKDDDPGKPVHQSELLGVHQRKHSRTPAGAINAFIWKNGSLSTAPGEIEPPASRQGPFRMRRRKHDDGKVATINDDLLAVGEHHEDLMELTTIDYSSYNFNFSSEKDGHFPTSIEETGNDTEITLSGRNETEHFGWTDFGWTDVALVTLFCSIIAGTVAGNMLVIAAVVTTRRLRTVTNCFVMSLAVADWLVGMFVMPPKVFLYFVDNEWRFGRIFCELWISLDILLCTASILSLCAISIDRYLAITRPLAYSRRRRSKRLALSMISCVWIAAVVITSPPIFGWYEENRNTDNKCDYNENTGYVVYSALGSFFLPLLVMLYVYARIACVITRRQRSIQKLHARGERKSQYCGSDAEEPLHQKDREDDGGRRESVEKQSHRAVTRLTSGTGEGGDGTVGNAGTAPGEEGDLSSGHIGHHQLGEKQSTSSQSIGNGNQETCNNNSFLGRIGLSSCTSANNDASSTKVKKKHTEHVSRQDKYGTNAQDKDGNATCSTAAALSLPDPATLVSGNETENSSSNGGGGGSGIPEQDSGCSLPTNVNQAYGQKHHRLHHHHHYVSKMKTGSRLCHHSIATTSPQKNIHRIHQTSSSSSGRDFADDEMQLQLRSVGSCRSLDRSPRVWTVEATSSSSPASTGAKRKGKEVKVNSHNCKSCSYEHELAESGNPATDKEAVMVMECSPAGNPASLMSAASASGNNSSISQAPHERRSPYLNRVQSRIYQPHSTQNSHNHHHSHHRLIQNNQMENACHPAVGMQRAKSMKFVSHIHNSNDQNHNGGSALREFSSGRIASFKRETKTAQTLAAVVGGFIICWLPFFLAYVMGPFTPSSDTIPSALMDALIWLGWSNSAINPFIYAFYSQDFRSAFWRLTVHKCEALLINRNQTRSSPRRYEDPPQQQHHRVSA